MRLILGIPIILWLIAGGYWIYKDRKSMIQLQIIPLEKKIEASKDELAKLVEDNRRVDEFRKQKEVKLRLIRKLGEEFRDTADKMPRAANVPELLKSFADRSDDTGIAFNSFIPGAGKAYPRANYIIVTPVKIKIRGTFLQILTFLDSIAHLTRVVSIERLKLKIDGVRNKSTILEADVSMSTYHLDGVKLARAARRKADRKNKEEKKDK